MEKCGLGGQSAMRIIDEHFLEETITKMLCIVNYATYLKQINAFSFHAGHKSTQNIIFPTRKVRLVIRKLCDAGPDIFRWGAHTSEDAEQLINLRVAVEEWLPCNHLRKNASNAPDINRSGVALTTKKNLRGAIPESNDFVCVDANGNTERASKTEISQLDGAVVIEQKILWLQIAMNDSPLVAENDCVCDLVHVALEQ